MDQKLGILQMEVGQVYQRGNMVQPVEQEFGYVQLLNVLLRRGWWVVGTISLALVTALLFTLTRDPIYQSSMQMIIEPNFEEELDPAELDRTPSQRQREENLATQLNLMRSRELLQRAVDSLQDAYPELTAQTVRSSLSLSRVQEGGDETRIVGIVYTDTDPVRAERILEALQAVYLSYALERQEQRLNQGLGAIDNQFDEARRSLSSSQSRLKEFRQNQDIIDPERQATVVTDSLNRILSEQRSLETEYQEALARYNTLREQISLSEDSAIAAARLSQSARFQSLLNALQETELALAERRVIYSDADPGVQGLVAQRQNQLELLRQEAQRVLGSDAAGITSAESLQDFGQLSALDLNLVQNLAEVESTLEGLTARRQSLVQAEQEARAELDQFPELIDSYNRLEPEVQTQQTVLEQLLRQRELLSSQLARGGFNWQVVANPSLGVKIGPDHRKNMLLGAVAGLVLGGTVAFIREALDDVIRTPKDIQRLAPVPLLGVLSDKKPSDAVRTPHSVPVYQHNGERLEAGYWLSLRDSLDLIYKSVQLYQTDVAKSLAITSTRSAESSSTLAVGLALSAARIGQRVIIVDANLRSSTLQERFNFPEGRGLNALLDQPATRLIPVSTTLLGTSIDVLPATLEAHDSIKILSSPRFRVLIEALENRYDLVILDSPPVLGSADVLEIAACCGDLVLVAPLNQTTEEELQASLAALSQLNNLAGIVASDVPYPAANSVNTDTTYPGKLNSQATELSLS
ncbi:Chain length determinant protein [Synechococcus sp. PCC 7335]|uniref:GumC family protein n=1 Tax=Synechococcus sp. (strain ATCC 29403 / PCC 7335) TaxID=91464 RepID=UPI00017EB06B|nr:polysaccharide biosynthesis tyrosine autokinase [Synechococcus sp. PCC 7335]EDX87685.1 Chain length determinant protein [Synechococcus sp. PCC 7335]